MWKVVILLMIILRIVFFGMCCFRNIQNYKGVKNTKIARFEQLTYIIDIFYQVMFLIEIALFVAFIDAISEKLIAMWEFLLGVTKKAAYKTYDLIFARFEPKENGDDE